MSDTPERAAARGAPFLSPVQAGTAVVLLAVLARALEAIQQPRLFNDGPRFVAMAENFARREWWAALGDAFHPLTAFVMAVLGSLLPVSFETAGQLANVLAGGAGAWALWGLTRDQFGDRVALAGAIVFALQPRLVASSSGVQSDGIHLALFLLGAWASWRALERRGAVLAALAGLLCGLAYLTRPEGLVVAAVFGLWLGVDALRRRLSWGSALTLGASFGAALLIVGGPYVLTLHELSGEWTLTRKKQIARVEPVRQAPLYAQGWGDPPGLRGRLRGAPDFAASFELRRVAFAGASVAALSPDALHEAPPLEPWLQAAIAPGLSEVLADGLRALQTPALLLALLGLLRGPPSRSTLFIGGFVGIFFLMLMAVHAHSGYVSRRHWLPVVALVSPFVGRGGLRLLGWLPALPGSRAIPRIRGLVVSAAIVGLLAHAAIPQMDAHKVARRNAALWLKQEARPAMVAAKRARDAYFAGAEHVPLEAMSGGMLYTLAHARDEGAQFALVDSEEWVMDDKRPPPWIQEMNRVSYRGHEVVILMLGR